MIKINTEFKNLISPLSNEEYSQLEKNIIKDGCRDPIVLWNDTIVDGHNRYKICTDNNIEFNTINRDFDNETEVEIWMIHNQFGKRNITSFQRAELALKLKPLLAEKGKENLSNAGKGFQNSEKVNTSKEISKEAGVSHDTIHKVEKILEKAPEEIVKKVRAGEVSINQAHKEVVNAEKKEKRSQDIQQQRMDIEEGVAVLPEGKFEVIAIDPPWNYGREYDPESSRVANPYPEMNQAQLMELEIPSADDSVMFLWTTHAFIFDAKDLLDKWGFKYKATLVWNKEQIGIGHWFRMQCEFCLVGIKGKPTWDNTTWRDIINEKRREHSRKPELFYQMVEEVTVGRRLEYFSRTARDRWEIFGNDVGRLSV